MNHKHLLRPAFGAHVIVLLLVACAQAIPTPPASQPAPEVKATAPSVIKLTFWHGETPPNRVAAMKEMIDKFNQSHPNIQITQDTFAWADVYTKLATAINAGTNPDFVFTLPDFTMFIYKTGAVQPVDDLVAEMDQKHHYPPSQIQLYNWDGHYWGVTLWSMAFKMMVRQDILDQAGIKAPPKTWDETLEVAKTMKQKGLYGFALPASKHQYTDQALWSFMTTARADIFDENCKIVFDNPATVRTLKFYQELAQYAPPDIAGWAWPDGNAVFIAGKAPLQLIFGPLRYYAEQIPDKTAFVKAAPVPTPKDGVPGTYSVPNGAMLLTKDPAKQAAFKEFIRFLMEPDNNGYWLGRFEPGNFAPATEDAAKSDAFWNSPVIAQFKDVMKVTVDVIPTGKLYGFTQKKPCAAIGEISGANVLGETVQKMVVEGKTAEYAATWGQQRMLEVSK
jgi:multiple sugar transport system substrate-binding protein